MANFKLTQYGHEVQKAIDDILSLVEQGGENARLLTPTDLATIAGKQDKWQTYHSGYPNYYKLDTNRNKGCAFLLYVFKHGEESTLNSLFVVSVRQDAIDVTRLLKKDENGELELLLYEDTGMGEYGLVPSYYEEGYKPADFVVIPIKGEPSFELFEEYDIGGTEVHITDYYVKNSDGIPESDLSDGTKRGLVFVVDSNTTFADAYAAYQAGRTLVCRTRYLYPIDEQYYPLVLPLKAYYQSARHHFEFCGVYYNVEYYLDFQGEDEIDTTSRIPGQAESTPLATLAQANSKYTKPSSGIPKSDLDGAVQQSLNKADDIERLIPEQASEQNQLADKNFVNSSIQTETATFRGNWETWSDVPLSDMAFHVDNNDYLVVRDASDYAPYWRRMQSYPEFSVGNIVSDGDEYNGYGLYICIASVDYDVTEGAPRPSEDVNREYWAPYNAANPDYEGTWRFKYSGHVGYDKLNWLPEYQINEKPLTEEQLAALNSGITAEKVTEFEGKYTRPADGIPESDLSDAVKAKLLDDDDFATLDEIDALFDGGGGGGSSSDSGDSGSGEPPGDVITCKLENFDPYSVEVGDMGDAVFKKNGVVVSQSSLSEQELLNADYHSVDYVVTEVSMSGLSVILRGPDFSGYVVELYMDTWLIN